MKPWKHRRSNTATPRRISIDLAGDWRACTNTLPKGCQILGTVSVGPDTGALVRLAVQRSLVMVREGAIIVLNQTQVRLMIEAAARPSTALEMVPVEQWKDP